MKKIFLFGSHLWLYLTEIPVIFLLCVVISVHDTGPAIVKFYPLEIALGSLAVFIVIFFFRGVIISKDEIRQVGRFTPRYKSMIEEGKTLVFTLFSKNNLTVELYERDDAAPSLPWAGDVAGEINLFRARTIGNHRAVRRTLILFGLTGTGYFDMYAYEKFNNGIMTDFVPTDDDLQAAKRYLPEQPNI